MKNEVRLNQESALQFNLSQEERFDRFTRMLSRYFNVPLVFITFIEEDKLWLKSKVGSDLSFFNRNNSICSSTASLNKELLIPNLDDSEDFNKLKIANFPIKFYYGMPLRLPNGLVIGTICMMDHSSREVAEGERAFFRDITKSIEWELSRPIFELSNDQSPMLLQSILSENSFDALISLSLDGTIKLATQKALSLFEYEQQDLIGSNFERLIPKRSKVKLHNVLKQLAKSGFSSNAIRRFQFKCIRRSGEEFPVNLTVKKSFESDQHLLLKIVDISQILERHRLLQVIIESLPDLIFIKDTADLSYVYCNQNCALAMGHQVEDVIGKKDADLLPSNIAKAFLQDDKKVLRTGNVLEIENEYIEYPDQTRRYFHTKKLLIADPETNKQYILGLSEDITDGYKKESQLFKRANEDSLTGLANRFRLHQFIKEEISRAQRSLAQFSVVYVDLDGFKPINDHHGHKSGDAILETLGERMSDAIRGGDCAARIGGDEFVFVITNLKALTLVDDFIERLLIKIRKPIYIDDECFELDASIGKVTYPSDGETLTELLEKADQAMYLAKRVKTKSAS
ncbi:MAG: diguanylate cyclase [Gammaproteobacteria bacterium]|nr:diguanylate cyclase [Gammaproteobacteria bacterium]